MESVAIAVISFLLGILVGYFSRGAFDSNSDVSGGSGGSGGGGDGGGWISSSGSPGNNGTDGLGGGGGGGANQQSGGDGGDGVVIIRYDATLYEGTDGTITTDGDDKIHTFNGDGTFNLSEVSSDESNAIFFGSNF